MIEAMIYLEIVSLIVPLPPFTFCLFPYTTLFRSNLIEEFKFKLQRRDNLLRLAPQLAATPWGGSPPRPLRQKISYSDCTENCPLSPLRAPRRFRNPRFPFTYRFAARVPSDSKGSECQCGIHTAEAASALRSRKTQRAAKEKSTPISQIF